ncbi:NAD-P-binding protein [Trametes polyzona]|nr:NAD-P-binding protein [Trametes polyzona]
MSNVYVWLITGASRGIGLELSKQLLATTSDIVIATCRTPATATALNALAESAKGRLHVVPLDITNDQSVKDSVQKVASILGDRGIDYLINNAGVTFGGDDRAFNIDLDALRRTFETNVVGPTHVSEVYLPYVEKSEKKTVVNVSSTLGSVGTDLGHYFASYSITKAAVNMLTYKQSKARPDLTVVCICPGHLKTDMGGPNAALEVSVGVEGVRKVIQSLTHEDTGKFVNYKGEHVPW